MYRSDLNKYLHDDRNVKSVEYRKAHNANVLLKINVLAVNSGKKPLCAYTLASL
jgi:hypothetical protein